MGKRHYTIRLYKSHDKDILSLTQRGLSITIILYNCLKGFCHRDFFIITLPEKETLKEPTKSRNTQFKLILDEEQDSDIIGMIERFNPGARNNFFKQLIRLYVCYPIDERYFKSNEDKQWFDEQVHIFRQGRKCVDSEKMKPKRRRAKKSISNEKVFFAKEKEEKDIAENIPRQDSPKTVYSDELAEQINSIPIVPDNSSISQQEADEITDLFSSLFE